jgi:cell division protein ZapD
MIRVAVAGEAGCFAEISGGRHRFTIRFLAQPSLSERAAQVNRSIPFELTCCIL